MAKRSLAAALGSGMALLALGACKKEKPVEPWSVQEAVLVGRAYKLTVAQVAPCQVKSDTNKPLSSEITLGFDVILEATGDQQVGIHPSGFKISDGQGYTHKAFFDGGCQPELDSLRLIGKNEKHRGWFSVNVPEATRELKVAVQAAVARSTEPDEVRFEVQRGAR